MKNKFILLLLAVSIISCKNTTEKKTAKTIETKPVTIDSMQVSKRQILLDGADNFRDLGGFITKEGKTIKWGKIFRADKLSELTANDFQKLETLNIKTVVDFRSNSEIEKEPDTLPNNVNYLHLPIGLDNDISKFMDTIKTIAPNDMEQMMISFYKELPIKWANQYKSFFNKVINSTEGPLVFHCTAGKDRTGIGSALFLYMLGVDMNTIYKDYELSNFYRKEANEKFVKMFEQYGINAETGEALMIVKADYLKQIFANITAEHGSVDSYIKNELGITAEDQNRLKEIYLQ